MDDADIGGGGARRVRRPDAGRPRGRRLGRPATRGREPAALAGQGLRARHACERPDAGHPRGHRARPRRRSRAPTTPRRSAATCRRRPSSPASTTTVAERLQAAIAGETLRVYTNDDVLGVEFCGAMKNPIAVAVGMSDGLGFGDNSRAALMTRGLAEVARLGLAQGARFETFSGLAGIGDLIATCTSRHSRNRRAGELLAAGATPGRGRGAGRPGRGGLPDGVRPPRPGRALRGRDPGHRERVRGARGAAHARRSASPTSWGACPSGSSALAASRRAGARAGAASLNGVSGRLVDSRGRATGRVPDVAGPCPHAPRPSATPSRTRRPLPAGRSP